MSGFSAEWLALREPLDAESRAASLTAAFAASLRTGPIPAVEVVDLGAGTGANLRYLAPLIGGAQRWRLLDADAALRAAAAERLAAWAGHVGARCTREGQDELLITGPGLDCRVHIAACDLAADPLESAERAAVTASALLDLVSEDWLRRLAAECRHAHAPVLFALTYDGRMQCRPRAPEDALLVRLFNAHQRRNKGFGPALGPDAPRTAVGIFEALGYRVQTAPSDWRVGPRDRDLQAGLLDGWVAAAAETAPEHEPELRVWLERRRAQCTAGALELVVGHVDLAATL